MVIDPLGTFSYLYNNKAPAGQRQGNIVRQEEFPSSFIVTAALRPAQPGVLLPAANWSVFFSPSSLLF